MPPCVLTEIAPMSGRSTNGATRIAMGAGQCRWLAICDPDVEATAEIQPDGRLHVAPSWTGRFLAECARKERFDGRVAVIHTRAIHAVGFPFPTIWWAEVDGSVVAPGRSIGRYRSHTVQFPVEVTDGHASMVREFRFQLNIQYAQCSWVPHMWMLGAVLNVATMSVGVFMCRLGVSRGRAAWRRRHGRCAYCNYPTWCIRGDRCPECGGRVTLIGSRRVACNAVNSPGNSES